MSPSCLHRKYTNVSAPASWPLSNAPASRHYTTCSTSLAHPLPPPVQHKKEQANDNADASADLFIWTSIESNTIIIAACVPTIAPLIE